MAAKAAETAAKVLHPHFVKEEEALAMTDKVKAEIGPILEHKSVMAALNDLADAARKKNKTEYIHFVEKLVLQAQNEEFVLYAAAILVGEYLEA